MGEIAEVPKQAKAIVYDNPGTISTKVVTVDVPEPGPGEVLINLYVQAPICCLYWITPYSCSTLMRSSQSALRTIC